MAKWDLTDEATVQGAIRAVNYVDGTHRPKDAFGNEGPEMPVFKYRLEQFGLWGWQPVPVYQEQPDGSLVEIKQ